MDDRRALMAAILADPEDDTPRLVFADWLQEHGDEHDRARAEFIRLQIKEVRAKYADDRRKAEGRAATLHKRHAEHWIGPLDGLPTGTTHNRDKFARGILVWWYTSAGNFLKKPHQEAVCEWFPRLGVDLLVLCENSKRVSAVANSPALAWVTRFRWRDSRLEDDGFAALAASPHAARWRSLDIDKPRCSDAGLKALANSDGFPDLRAFELEDGLWRGKFSAAGVRQILDSPKFPKLDELGLTGAHKHAVTHSTLWTYRSLSRLRVLRLGSNNDMKGLAKCPHLTNLEELHVAGSTLDDVTARVLLDNPAFARLKVLELRDMNPYHARLDDEVEMALFDRCGDGLTVKYSVLCRGR